MVSPALTSNQEYALQTCSQASCDGENSLVCQVISSRSMTHACSDSKPRCLGSRLSVVLLCSLSRSLWLLLRLSFLTLNVSIIIGLHGDVRIKMGKEIFQKVPDIQQMLYTGHLLVCCTGRLKESREPLVCESHGMCMWELSAVVLNHATHIAASAGFS